MANVIDNYFENDETGAAFLQRNEHISIAPSKVKPGKLFFAAAVDGIGAVSDKAAKFLQQEMSKPGATLQAAICQLAVGTIVGTDTKCLHVVGKPTNVLYSC